MNLTKIKNISELNINDKVAITHCDKLGDINEPNVNLLIGKVYRIVKNTNNEILSVEIATTNPIRETQVMLTDMVLMQKSVYLITEYKTDTIIKSHNDRLIKSNNTLIKKLEKAEKLNRKYRAMLKKRFGATDEQIDSNFTVKNINKRKEFIEYKVINDRIPCFINGQRSSLLGKFTFSSNNKSKIKCKIEIIKDNEVSFSVSSIATCNKEDIFNIATGEFIASSKAMAKVVIKAH